jgi:transcriptional regulator with XRE-family HTH domain
MKTKTSHGYNVRRMRQILDVKQETVAGALSMTQQNYSKLEKKAEIEDKLLAKIAEELQIPVEAIKNYDDKCIFNVISNSFTGSSSVAVINPIDKVAELYERIIKEKDGQIELLKNLLEKK